MKSLLALFCSFTIAATLWLVAMEQILKHPGYNERSVMDACILLQAVGTLAALRRMRHPIFRVAILTGAAALIWLGTSAAFNILRAEHFEGFALVIGLALILQGSLTLLVLFPPRRHVLPA